MATGRPKIDDKQAAAIVALLSEPTHEAAARKAGVSESTLARWLKLPAFRRAFQEAGRRMVEVALGCLQAGTGEAVATLRRNLKCGQSATEVRAAVAWLQQSVRALELLDLTQRVEELETLLREGDDGDEAESGGGEDVDVGASAGEDEEGRGSDDAMPGPDLGAGL